MEARGRERKKEPRQRRKEGTKGKTWWLRPLKVERPSQRDNAVLVRGLLLGSGLRCRR